VNPCGRFCLGGQVLTPSLDCSFAGGAVVDYFELPRQVAATAAHFLDRYLSSWSCSKSDLQLLMMSALYLAIKTHQRHPLLSVETMLRTSRGLFSRDQLLRMERHLLDALTWRLHPPLPENVLDIFLRVLVRCYPVEQYTAINDQCLYYLDTALVDGFFVGHSPSVVAMAALCQVLELYIRNDTHEGYPHPMHELMRRTHLMIPAGPCHACRDRFARIMAADETVPDALPKPGSQPVARERMPSPVSVLHPSLDHAGKEA
jgi:hypothetical protein